ncbi:MAG TPA: 6,7-dimethyl-8-ribityllumazine synthase [Acidimicrobiia bacterium]
MSGTAGAGETEGDAVGMRVAVVQATFHAHITDGLADGALAAIAAHGADASLVKVPGAFELPLAAKRLAQTGHDAVVAVGAVIEGETDHYEHIAHRASEGLMAVMLETGVPIGFGLLTVRQEAHAVARSGPGAANKGAEAADAAVRSALVLRDLEVPGPR